MASTTTLFFTFTIFLSLIYKSSAIYCYDCNSANNSACIDPMEYDDETRAKIIPAIHCEANITRMDPDLHFFCRKIVQTIYLPHYKTELRVTRGCGWVPADKPCYKNDHATHLETACQCFSSFCNSAENESMSATIIFVMLAACLCFYR